MDYTARLLAKGNPDKLFTCLSSEETKFERSAFTIKKTEEGVEFDISAKDAVALRATLNSITQLLTIFEGVEKRARG